MADGSRTWPPHIGLYYHGARYYIPWLGRWLAVDPINSEIYNWNKENPKKNLERQTTELTASSYEYCYDNPVRFIDPTGEQPPINDITPVSQMNIQSQNSDPTGSTSFDVNRILLNSEKFKEILGVNGEYGKNGIPLEVGTKSMTDNLGETSIYAIVDNVRIAIDKVTPDQVNSISGYSIVIAIADDIKDFELIDTFNHEVDHATSLAKVFKENSGKGFNALLKAFKEDVSKNEENHIPMITNTGLYNSLMNSTLVNLSSVPRALFNSTGNNTSGAFQNEQIATYNIPDNFYNRVVNHSNEKIKDYNNQFPGHRVQSMFKNYVNMTTDMQEYRGKSGLHDKTSPSTRLESIYLGHIKR